MCVSSFACWFHRTLQRVHLLRAPTPNEPSPTAPPSFAANNATSPPPDALTAILALGIMNQKARRLEEPTRLATGSDSSEPSEFRSAFESILGNREPSLFSW